MCHIYDDHQSVGVPDGGGGGGGGGQGHFIAASEAPKLWLSQV
jgi:hypothetical protein